jgi:hypothetical protein
MQMSSQLHILAAIPWERTLVSIHYKAGLTPELVWTLRRREKYSVPAGNRTPDNSVRSLATILTALFQLPVHAHVRMCVCVCVCVCARAHTRVRACAWTCVDILTYLYVCFLIYIHICAPTVWIKSYIYTFSSGPAVTGFQSPQLPVDHVIRC